MVPKLFVFSKIFVFLHLYRLPCELENARVLYKIKRKFVSDDISIDSLSKGKDEV